jgi:phospholipid/cholesterol/gamma-HCH transport system substrate-binding protein
MRRAREDHRAVPFGRTIILLQALAAIALLVYLLSHEYVRIPFLGPSHYEVRAAFTDAAGLSGDAHSPVTVAGVPLGRVTAVHYHDGLAIATLELPESVKGKVFADAQARIIPRSALEDLMVDIAPGSPAAGPLPAGSTIPSSRTSSTVGFDRVIDTLDADTRAQVQVLLGQLSTGLAGRAGDLRAGLGRLGRLVDVSSVVTRQLAERRGLLVRLVGDLDTLATELGNRDRELGDVVDAGQRTLAVTAARDAQLAGTVRLLPSTLASLSNAMNAIGALAPSLDPALEQLRPFARELPAALASLRGFVPAGTVLAGDLDVLATEGAQPVSDLRAAASALEPAATQLRSPTADLLPILRDIDRDKGGIGELGDNFSGVFSGNDANGPILRGLGSFEPFNAADVGFPPNASGAQLALAKSESVLALTRVCEQINPLACLVRYLIPGLPGSVVPSSLSANFTPRP